MRNLATLSYKHPQNLQLLLDLGVARGTDKIPKVCELFCKLLGDSVVRERRYAYARVKHCTLPSVKVIVDQMTKAEKIKLRDRILGVISMQGGK